MKTKEQVIRYLSRRSYPQEDWLIILQECREIYGSGVRKSLRPKSESTIKEFHKWLSDGIGDGTIVRCGNITGLYCDNGDGTAKLIARYVVKEKIVVGDVPVDIKSVTEVEKEEANKFYINLRKQGYQYNPTLATISERNVPRHCQIVKFLYHGIKHLGILLKVKAGIADFACSYEYNGGLKSDLSYDLFDLDFLNVTKDDKIKLKEILYDNNVSFDKKSLQLVHCRKRAEFGDYYWFITDIFSIKRVADKRGKSDEIRYDVGNYFLDYKRALDFRNEIVEKRKGQD